MRKGYDSLGGIVRAALGRDPTDGAIYCFVNLRRDRIKLLLFEGDGFAAYYKILAQGTLELPTTDPNTGYATITQGLFATAITYALNHWPEAAAMLRDGRIALDNNGIESVIRWLALGRKNYLFAGSHGAAQNAAVLYSLLLTCKACVVAILGSPDSLFSTTFHQVGGFYP